jgi:hypothetical protein
MHDVVMMMMMMMNLQCMGIQGWLKRLFLSVQYSFNLETHPVLQLRHQSHITSGYTSKGKNVVHIHIVWTILRTRRAGTRYDIWGDRWIIDAELWLNSIIQRFVTWNGFYKALHSTESSLCLQHMAEEIDDLLMLNSDWVQ